MKAALTAWIENFVTEAQMEQDVTTKWRTPLVGFANASHPEILNLKQLISPQHQLPTEVLPEATIVVSYFVPFTKALGETNKTPGETTSREWALAYEETNAMFGFLNAGLVEQIKAMGFDAAIPSESRRFSRETLTSNWSQRHLAKAAGLGTFGLNNMLITKEGCCGRFGSVVTTLPVEPDAPLTEEYCIYKKSRRCAACVVRCPSGALTVKGFDRHQCYELLVRNATLFQDLGSSYEEGPGEKVGSEVCGKCVTQVPCAFFDHRPKE